MRRRNKTAAGQKSLDDYLKPKNKTQKEVSIYEKCLEERMKSICDNNNARQTTDTDGDISRERLQVLFKPNLVCIGVFYMIFWLLKEQAKHSEVIEAQSHPQPQPEPQPQQDHINLKSEYDDLKLKCEKQKKTNSIAGKVNCSASSKNFIAGKSIKRF